MRLRPRRDPIVVAALEWWISAPGTQKGFLEKRLDEVCGKHAARAFEREDWSRLSGLLRMDYLQKVISQCAT